MIYHPTFKSGSSMGPWTAVEGHTDCQIFVLDLSHDPLARVALVRYAQAASDRGHSQLSGDIYTLLSTLSPINEGPD